MITDVYSIYSTAFYSVRTTYIHSIQSAHIRSMFALIHLISETGTSKNKRVVLGNTLPAKKMAESEDMIDVCDDLGIESFFEHVLNRKEELLDENSNVSGEHRISTHFDLLERTVRLLTQLARIVTYETDLKLLGDLRVVFSELLEKFLHHFGSTASYTSQVITFPSLLVKSEGPGRPSGSHSALGTRRVERAGIYMAKDC